MSFAVSRRLFAGALASWLTVSPPAPKKYLIPRNEFIYQAMNNPWVPDSPDIHLKPTRPKVVYLNQYRSTLLKKDTSHVSS